MSEGGGEGRSGYTIYMCEEEIMKRDVGRQEVYNEWEEREREREKKRKVRTSEDMRRLTAAVAVPAVALAANMRASSLIFRFCANSYTTETHIQVVGQDLHTLYHIVVTCIHIL